MKLFYATLACALLAISAEARAEEPSAPSPPQSKGPTTGEILAGVGIGLIPVGGFTAMISVFFYGGLTPLCDEGDTSCDFEARRKAALASTIIGTSMLAVGLPLFVTGMVMQTFPKKTAAGPQAPKIQLGVGAGSVWLSGRF